MRFTIDEGQNWYGLYLQDQITLPYNFHLLAGFRYDNANIFSTQVFTIPSSTINAGRVSEDAIKPRIGLLWQPIPQLSLFGDFVEGFGVSNLVGGGGEPSPDLLPPQQSRQWEAGIKMDILGEQLTSTLAWFDIIKTNIPTPSSDPVLRAQGVQVATGAVKNRGLDFDISGRLTPELKVISSFAYINSKIVEDNNGNVGNRFYGVPTLGGSLWAVYEPYAELFRGLALGAGFVVRSDFEFDNANSFALPGYTTVDLMARYGFSVNSTKLSFQLNVNNLFDKRYYLSGGTPGTPRTILGAIRVEF